MRWQRLYTWSSGAMVLFGLALVAAATTLLVSASAYARHDVPPGPGHPASPAETASVSGDPYPILILLFAVIGIVAVIALLINAASSSSGGSGSTPHDHGVPPPGGLVLALAIAGALLGIARPAHAIVDCMDFEDMCKPGTECGWDANLHIHRCLPVAPASNRERPSAPTQVPAPTTKPAVSPSATASSHDDCATPQTVEGCPADYPVSYLRCLREVAAHNKQCEKLKACTEARRYKDRICAQFERTEITSNGIACGKAMAEADRLCATTQP